MCDASGCVRDEKDEDDDSSSTSPELHYNIHFYFPRDVMVDLSNEVQDAFLDTIIQISGVDSENVKNLYLERKDSTSHDQVVIASFTIHFKSVAHKHAAKAELDHSLTHSTSTDADISPDTSDTNNAETSLFLQTMSYSLLNGQGAQIEWDMRLTKTPTAVMVPARNCSALNGQELYDTLQISNVALGEYCLLSMLGWTHFLRPIANCVVNGSSLNDTIISLSSVMIQDPTLSDQSDGVQLELMLSVSMGIFGLVILVSMISVWYRRKYQNEKRSGDALRVKHYQMRKQLKASALDIKLLVRAWEINMSELKLVSQIGRGTYGEVWKGRWREKLDVAVKFIRAPNTNNVSLPPSSSDNMINARGQHTPPMSDVFERSEVKFLMRTRSPYIVLFLGCGSRGKRDHFVMTEYCNGGSFDSVLWTDNVSPTSSEKSRAWNLTERLHVLLDACEGLRFLHMIHRSIHRDIKSPNVLLTKRPDDHYRKTRWMGKLADFGLSEIVLRGKRRHLRKNQQNDGNVSNQGDMWKKRFQHGMVGTLEWMAPELLIGTKRYGPEIDVYSTGIMVWETMCCERPWRELSHDVEEVTSQVTSGRRPKIADAHLFPVDLVSLMNECWSHNPDDRPSIENVTKRLYDIIEEPTKRCRDPKNRLTITLDKIDDSDIDTKCCEAAASMDEGERTFEENALSSSSPLDQFHSIEMSSLSTDALTPE